MKTILERSDMSTIPTSASKQASKESGNNSPITEEEEDHVVTGRKRETDLKYLLLSILDQAIFFLSTFQIVIQGTCGAHHHAHDSMLQAATPDAVEIQLPEPHKMQMGFARTLRGTSRA